MKPLSRPKEVKSHLEARLKNAGIEIKDSIFLVGVRGYYKESMGNPTTNDVGIYDDAIFIVEPTKSTSFNANTDPSKYTPGIAKLVPGVHEYKKGNHGISKPGGGYPALRPANAKEALPVTRTGKEGVFDGIAINIHKGGYNTTSSAGCQTIYPDQWKEFIDKVYKLMDEYKQKKISYVLLDN